jgi:hypothetical protein
VVESSPRIVGPSNCVLLAHKPDPYSVTRVSGSPDVTFFEKSAILLPSRRHHPPSPHSRTGSQHPIRIFSFYLHLSFTFRTGITCAVYMFHGRVCTHRDRGYSTPPTTTYSAVIHSARYVRLRPLRYHRHQFTFDSRSPHCPRCPQSHPT